MAEIENVVIFRADTGAAVRTVGDLKESIKFLKKELDNAEVGTKEYADTLVQLQTQQAALKNAMHDTTYETNSEADAFASTAKQAKGLGDSYNALVRRMAELDQEFRRTEDTAKRQTIGAQIKEINQRLKDMDAERGKFQRNVGDYFGQALTSNMQKVVGALGNMGAGFRNVTSTATQATNAFKTLSATPVLGVLTLIAGALGKVVNGMQTCEENTNSWNRALAAFKPIGDAFTRTMQDIGAEVAGLANKFVDLLYRWGLLDEEAGKNRQAIAEMEANIVQRRRVILVANAQLEADVAEAREKAADKERYTAAERLKFLEEAGLAEKRIAKNNLQLAQDQVELLKRQAELSGNSTGTLNALAQAEAEVERARAAGAMSARKLLREINGIRREMGKAVVDTKEATDAELTSIETILAAMEAGDKERERLENERLAADKKRQEEIDAVSNDLVASFADETTALQAELDAQLTAEYDAMMEEREIQQQRINTFTAYTSGIANLASSLAGIYEADSEASEEAARKAKELKTASAIVSTIGGAISAYMNTIETIPNPFVGIPLAVINAASVLAAGYAQVKQINSVKVGKGGGSSVSMPAAVAAPAASVAGMTQVRTVTGASEEERLNQMASAQRVYIVESDIEGALNASRVRVAEATF